MVVLIASKLIKRLNSHRRANNELTASLLEAATTSCWPLTCLRLQWALEFVGTQFENEKEPWERLRFWWAEPWFISPLVSSYQQASSHSLLSQSSWAEKQAGGCLPEPPTLYTRQRAARQIIAQLNHTVISYEENDDDDDDNATGGHVTNMSPVTHLGMEREKKREREGKKWATD